MLFDLMITRALDTVNIPINTYLSPLEAVLISASSKFPIPVDVHIRNLIFQSSNDTHVCVKLMQLKLIFYVNDFLTDGCFLTFPTMTIICQEPTN